MKPRLQLATALLVTVVVPPALASMVFAYVSSTEAHRDRTAAGLLEAAYAAQDLASGIAACADRARADPPHSNAALPPSSKKVPAALPRGAPSPADARDWDEPAFRCADFRILTPQGFQLSWVLHDKPTAEFLDAEGFVRAEADLDGDGVVDHVVQTSVGCGRDGCMVAPDVVLSTHP